MNIIILWCTVIYEITVLLLRTLRLPEIGSCKMTGLDYLYIGRRSRYNEFVPICAMKAHWLSGGIAPLVPKLDYRQMWVV